MLLFWRIRYLDTREKQFKDRDLWLGTDTLDPVTRAAVEAMVELRDTGNRRSILKYRHLFQERNYNQNELNELFDRYQGMRGVDVYEYFEDENCEELTYKRMAVVLTGNPDAEYFPGSLQAHDVEFAVAKNVPIPIDSIAISKERLDILGCFARDVREIQASAFYQEGPGRLVQVGVEKPYIETAVTDEEIRSFVTIFRRLYMAKEPANFHKATVAFAEVIPGHPLARWVTATAGHYARELESPPDLPPFVGCQKCSFTSKQLIDVFLYTQYAHQPDKRKKQDFKSYLGSVGGSVPLLTWLFLHTIWRSALCVTSAGAVIASFYDEYCRRHNTSADVPASIASSNPGIGAKEKKSVQRSRVLHEKAAELADIWWNEQGRPEGGPAQFLDKALAQIALAMNGETRVRKEDA